MNLGAIGVFLLLALIISTFHKISGQLLTDFEFARLRFGFLFAFIFYNYSEVTLVGLHPLWTIFIIIAIDYPKAGPSKTKRWKTTGLGPLPLNATLQDRPRHAVAGGATPLGTSRKQSVSEGGGYNS